MFPGPETRVPALIESGAADSLPGLIIGRTDAGPSARLSVPPLEGRHLAILGETGMGKSSALLGLAVEASHRGGVVLLDPIGDTGRAFLAGLDSRQRERTVWISPTESPVAVDLIAAIRSDTVGAVAGDCALSDVVDALRRVRQSRFAETPYGDPDRGDRSSRVGRGGGPPGGYAAGRGAAPRGRWTPAYRDPSGSPRRGRRALATRPGEARGSGGERRLLTELTARPALARMLASRRPRFSSSELSADGRIVVITAEAAVIGEAAARYLLAIHLALFWSARLAVPRPAKTFLLLEEAQWYAHESVAEMLRLARRANVHLYLATQSFGSLPEPVAEAVRTNAADFLVFRGAPDDARELARWTPNVDPVQVLSLPRGRALLLRGKGALITPVTVSPPTVFPPERTERALDAARTASKPRWPDEEDAAPGAASAAPPSRPIPSDGGPFRDLWLVLWAAVLDAEGGDPVRVSLRRLREVADPDSGRVREAGRYLRARGVITEADRDASGAWWAVSRSAVAGMLGPGVGTEELAEATRRWRSATTQPS